MKILDTWLDEPLPLVDCTTHIFEPEPTFGDNHYRCARCGRLAVEESGCGAPNAKGALAFGKEANGE